MQPDKEQYVDVESPEFKAGVAKLVKEGEEHKFNIQITKHMPMTPLQFVELIDEFYLDAKMNNISRMGVKWGVWSRKMHEELRQRIEANDPEAIRFKYVIVYHTLKSELLELYYKKSKWGQAKKKRVYREAKKIRLIILAKDMANIPELDKESVTLQILRGFKGV